MADLFADSSGWATWADTSQRFHSLAVLAIDDVLASNGQVVTTNLVLTELVALLTRPLRMPRVMQISFLKDLRTASWVEVVHIDPALEAAAWQLWEARPDKEWSLVDCASFVLMQQRGLTEALTTDHHFEQAGLVRLLK
jgi:predicted nucleic acid-binding protein